MAERKAFQGFDGRKRLARPRHEPKRGYRYCQELGNAGYDVLLGYVKLDMNPEDLPSAAESSQSACCTALSYEIVANITVYNAAVDIWQSYIDQGASDQAIDNAYHVVIYAEASVNALEGVYSSAC